MRMRSIVSSSSRASRRMAVRSFCQLSSLSPQPCDVTVVGGGAAGLTAAFFAAREGKSVTVLERTTKAGTKILMSGGTRCNILPGSVDLNKDFFTAGSTSAMRAVFASWSLDECKTWIENEEEGLGLALSYEADTNKLFPTSNSSKAVRDTLVQSCQKLGVRFRYNSSVEGIERGPDGWTCRLKEGGDRVSSSSLVIATGGLSFPAVGTDGTGHRMMKALGLELRETYPALTPLTGPHPAGHSLAGLSMYTVKASVQSPVSPSASKSELKQPRSTPRTDLLFTHKGFSGPSVLDLSHHTIKCLNSNPPSAAGPLLIINWTGESGEVWNERLSVGGTAFVSNILRKHGIRERLADALCEESGLVDRKISQLKGSERAALILLLTKYPLKVTGSEGYKKAEVTGGGVPLEALNVSSMEAKGLPGLYLCGEICDVFGRIGGFNFYWAWVSGRLAGIGAALNGDTAAVRKSLRQQKDIWVNWQEEW